MIPALRKSHRLRDSKNTGLLFVQASAKGVHACMHASISRNKMRKDSAICGATAHLDNPLTSEAALQTRLEHSRRSRFVHLRGCGLDLRDACFAKTTYSQKGLRLIKKSTRPMKGRNRNHFARMVRVLALDSRLRPAENYTL